MIAHAVSKGLASPTSVAWIRSRVEITTVVTGHGPAARRPVATPLYDFKQISETAGICQRASHGEKLSALGFPEGFKARFLVQTKGRSFSFTQSGVPGTMVRSAGGKPHPRRPPPSRYGVVPCRPWYYLLIGSKRRYRPWLLKPRSFAPQGPVSFWALPVLSGQKDLQDTVPVLGLDYVRIGNLFFRFQTWRGEDQECRGFPAVLVHGKSPPGSPECEHRSKPGRGSWWVFPREDRSPGRPGSCGWAQTCGLQE